MRRPWEEAQVICSHNFRQPRFSSSAILDYDSNSFDDTSNSVCKYVQVSHTLQNPPPNISRTGYFCNGYQNISTIYTIKGLGVFRLPAILNNFAGTPMEASLGDFFTSYLYRTHAEKKWPK
jgi:hypothetical protein